MEDQLFNKLVTIRRQLHQSPELGFREFKTAALVAAYLQELEIPVERVATTGLIGTLKNGTGPTIVLRADMDALPVLENTDLPFRSQHEGAMHACGHDLHTAMLLGAANLLKAAPFNGTVKLVFQPSEEGNANSPEKGKSGGQLIIESGKLDDANAAIGLHVHPLLPVGMLSYKNGEALANISTFSIKVHGKGGHPGAMEHVIDPVLTAGKLIAAARTLSSIRSDPQYAVLAFTHVETLAEPSFNVIPSSVLLLGGLRAISITVYEKMVAELQALIKELETASGCQIELEFTLHYPSLLNDAGIHEKLSPVLEKVFGGKNIQEGKAQLLAEDFAFFSRLIPSQFYFLGAKTTGNNTYFLHHPQVTFNEECIKYGATFLAEAALELLKNFKDKS